VLLDGWRSISGEFSHRLLGASVIDKSLPSRGGGDEGGDRSVVEGPGQPVGHPMQPGNGVIGDQRVGPPGFSALLVPRRP